LEKIILSIIVARLTNYTLVDFELLTILYIFGGWLVSNTFQKTEKGKNSR
jgi:hypothetical protein